MVRAEVDALPGLAIPAGRPRLAAEGVVLRAGPLALSLILIHLKPNICNGELWQLTSELHSCIQRRIKTK